MAKVKSLIPLGQAPIPSAKQRRIAQLKIQGKKNRDIGEVEYPKAQLGRDGKTYSADVIVSRELKKPAVAQYLEQMKLQALKEHNVTWSRIIKPISDALEAGKRNESGEITPDHPTRLRAAKQGAELLQDKSLERDEVKEKLLDISEDMDEIQMIRLMKNKN